MATTSLDTVSGSTDIRTFRIDVPQTQLDDLHRRLDAVRWPDHAPGVGWTQGIPLSYIQELTRYWRETYDWRAQEARLNAFPQFRTEIDGHDLHFIHVRSRVPDAMPLVLTHGWPGSIVEFLGMIGPLIDPAAHGGDARDAFHVVVPTLPGFGFSGPAVGWTAERVARALAVLMARLGYDRYGAHGGDLGSQVTRHLARVDAEHVTGIHVTSILSALIDPATADPDDPADQRALAAGRRWNTEIGAYWMLQATRPQTLAYGFTDSPVGQMAWIAERFKDWTDSANAPEDAVDREAMLTNIMIYWLNATAGSAARYYFEDGLTWARPGPRIEVPVAVAQFPHDISVSVRRIAEPTHNIVRWTEFDHGGHFPGLEQPALLIEDLRHFYRHLRH
ncbi:epoxide hydrolase [Nocardia sp. JMUB6875]|uniref:epoxide hydrolase family protein n=1 Tax=Nocardia sp. JMUB6875 TaxID=3158170 RepID=UPI0032E7ED63